MDKERIAVIGAGALGSFYGAKLQQAGYPVQYQTSLAEQIPNAKLRVQSIWGDFELPVEAFRDPQGMEAADLILIATKAIPDLDYSKLLSPIIKDSSALILLQNGINQEERLQEAFPRNVILGALAFTCIHRTSPGEIEHIDYGLIKLGPHKKEYALMGKRVAEIMDEAGIKVEFATHLRRLRWEKLLWNIPFNSLSVALGGVSTREMIASEHSLDLVYKLMHETWSIAKAEGINLNESLIDQMVENTQKMTPYKTSMLLDYENRRPMEVEAILGEPLTMAMRHRVRVDTIYTIYRLLHYLNEKNLST
jgi:2-dehydropantoate 2-reductase